MKKIIIWMFIGIFTVFGCTFSLNTGPTGDTANQETSAQNFLPDISGYNRTNADSISDAITSVGGGASVISGNLPLSAAIAKIDDMIQCYQDVGAVAANVYTQSDISSVLQGEIPRLGALAVVNQDRLTRNLLNCALSGSEGFSAQTAAIEPCFGSGTFVRNGETIAYLYAATAPGLCSSFQAHFDTFG